MKLAGYIFMLGFFYAIPMEAQHEELPLRRNTIKIDLTSNFYYSRAYVFSYERVMRPYQTMVIHAGYQEFKPFSNFGTSIIVTNNRSASGFKFGTDYRFYLQKENKYTAPHGIYLGPYLSFLNFKNDRELEIDNNGVTESGLLKANLNIINIGFQLGYQFSFKDRWTIDLVFIGPSISNYRMNMKLEGNFSDPEDIQNDVIDAIIDRFPAFGDLIQDRSVTANGKTSRWAYGYRYQAQVGYRFGKKKK